MDFRSGCRCFLLWCETVDTAWIIDIIFTIKCSFSLKIILVKMTHDIMSFQMFGTIVSRVKKTAETHVNMREALKLWDFDTLGTTVFRNVFLNIQRLRHHALPRTTFHLINYFSMCKSTLPSGETLLRKTRVISACVTYWIMCFRKSKVTKVCALCE